MRAGRMNDECHSMNVQCEETVLLHGLSVFLGLSAAPLGFRVSVTAVLDRAVRLSHWPDLDVPYVLYASDILDVLF